MNFANSNSIWWLPPPLLGKQGSSMSQKMGHFTTQDTRRRKLCKKFRFWNFRCKNFLFHEIFFSVQIMTWPITCTTLPENGVAVRGLFYPPPSLPFSFIIVCLYIAGDRSLKTISNKSRSIYKERLSLPRFQSTFPLVCLEKKWIYRSFRKLHLFTITIMGFQPPSIDFLSFFLQLRRVKLIEISLLCYVIFFRSNFRELEKPKSK